uniref:Putative secreted protein n=1 Tax=Xenopsylla cheopis TaxID=163159 RepID=A0A6M2DXW7_XENCH
MLALVWYVMTFGALIIFFTFLSCSGGLCRRLPPSQSSTSNQSPTSDRKQIAEKPPAYELFAPPSYETVVMEMKDVDRSKKPECSVFTITT